MKGESVLGLNKIKRYRLDFLNPKIMNNTAALIIDAKKRRSFSEIHNLPYINQDIEFSLIDYYNDVWDTLATFEFLLEDIVDFYNKSLDLDIVCNLMTSPAYEDEENYFVDEETFEDNRLLSLSDSFIDVFIYLDNSKENFCFQFGGYFYQEISRFHSFVNEFIQSNNLFEKEDMLCV